MGLNVKNGEADPATSNNPLGTPSEIEAAGFDLSTAASCCVPVIVNGVAQKRGCMYAANCSKLFGRKGLRYGGFGPDSDKPGTEGKGREFVPYSIEYSDGSYKEDFTWCHIFMGSSLYDLLMNQNGPNYKGDKVRLLGKAGEGGHTGKGADIVVDELLPADPNNNKSRNYKLVAAEKVVTVLAAPRLKESLGILASRRSAEAADEADSYASFSGESRAAGVAPTGAVGGGVASAEPVAPSESNTDGGDGDDALPVRRRK